MNRNADKDGARSIMLVTFFLSGVCALIYEVIWTRLLGQVFGVSAFAVSTVLAAYMAGLALGSFYFGRLVDRSRKPARIYGWLEAGIGLFALLVPVLFSLTEDVYVYIFREFSPPGYLLNVIRFMLSFLVLIVPATLMGGTLPVVSRMFARKSEKIGADTGRLYSINALGAVIGCFLAGFFLIRVIGVNGCIWLAAAVNLIIGIVFLNFIPAEESTRETPEEMFEDGGRKEPTGIIYTVMCFFALSGFCALAYRALWARSLVFYLPIHSYAFSLTLTTFFAGLALGSIVFAGIVDSRKDLLTILGVIEIIIGVYAVFSTFMLIGIGPVIDNAWLKLGGGWVAFITAGFIGTFLIVFVPAFLFGAAFPVVIRICSSGLKKLGKTVGAVYSINIIGTIIGSFVCGSILIPLIGIAKSLVLTAFINISIGVFLLFLNPGLHRNVKKAVLAVMVLFIVLSAVYTPGSESLILSSAVFSGKSAENKLLHYREGATSTVAVMQGPEGVKTLNVNGARKAVASIDSLQAHFMLSYLPYLLHEGPKRALVIGYGLGVTSYSLMQPGMETVDCVETVSEELETDKYFSDVNHNVMDDPRLNLIIEDGRNHLLMTDKDYDIILSNAVHVKQSPNLYTKEFYELCSKHLAEDGIMCQRMPSTWLKEQEFKGLLKSFKLVFPHTYMWYVNPAHYVLIGLNGRLEIDFERFSNKIQDEKAGKDLGSVYLNDPYLLLSRCIMSEDIMDTYIKGARAHTDNNPYSEFERTVSPASSIIVPDSRYMDTIIPFLAQPGKNEGEAAEVESKLQLWIKTRGISIPADVAYWNNHREELWFGKYREVLKMNPLDRLAGYLVERFTVELEKTYIEMAEECMRRENNGGALLRYEKALSLNPDSVEALKGAGFIYNIRGMHDKAINMCRKILKIEKNSAEAHYMLGAVYSNKGMSKSSRAELKKALEIDPQMESAKTALENINKSENIP